MATTRRDLNALLGSRICHDLISPIGAIGNGVELLSMAGINAAPEIALISESVENANARIRFFRIAYGAASDQQSIGRSEVMSILRDMTKGARLAIDWQVSGDSKRSEVKLAFLLLQCLESSMPWGGQVLISYADGKWSLLGEAGKLKINEAHWDLLTDPGSEVEITSAEVHFALVPDLSRRIGRPVVTKLGDTRIAISF